jgi:DNA-binding transcriptional ArsR family regulator
MNNKESAPIPCDPLEFPLSMGEGQPPKRSKDERRSTPQAELRTLDDLTQIRALAHPLRMRILGALSEERTTKQVAELLHEKPTRLYHHVDALERAGLVQLTRTRPKRGTIEKYYRSVARTFEGRVSTGRRSEAPLEAVDDVMATAFATTSSEVSRLLERDGGSTLSGEGILTFLEVRATRAEIEKLRRRLNAAIGVAREEGNEEGQSLPRDERYRLTIAFYPLETGGADATRPPPAKKRTAKKRGAR